MDILSKFLCALHGMENSKSFSNFSICILDNGVKFLIIRNYVKNVPQSACSVELEFFFPTVASLLPEIFWTYSTIHRAKCHQVWT